MSTCSRALRTAATSLAVAVVAAPLTAVTTTASAAEAGTTTRIDPPAVARVMTGDARYFFTDRSWSPGPDSPEGLYVWDRTSGTSTSVSDATLGSSVRLGGVSANGRYVHFDKPTPNSGAAPRASYLLDRVTGKVVRTAVGGLGKRVLGAAGDVSNNGRIVVFSRYGDQYARNVARGKTKIVSVAPDGKPRGRQSTEVSLSGNGRYVVWTGKAGTRAGNKYRQVWVHDRVTRKTQLVSQAAGGGYGNAESRNPSVSNDGRRIAFTTRATNLVEQAGTLAGVVVRDLDTRRTTSVTDIAPGDAKRGGCGSMYETWDCVAISGDGRFVAFWTPESLVAEDTDAASGSPVDLYVSDLDTDAAHQVNVAPAGSTGPTDGVTGPTSWIVLISGDGQYVVWDDRDDTLDPTSVPSQRRTDNTYLRDRGPQV